MRYNDISPLENHHCAVAFQILAQPECNIFSNVQPDGFKQIRQVRGGRALDGRAKRGLGGGSRRGHREPPRPVAEAPGGPSHSSAHRGPWGTDPPSRRLQGHVAPQHVYTGFHQEHSQPPLNLPFEISPSCSAAPGRGSQPWLTCPGAGAHTAGPTTVP